MTEVYFVRHAEPNYDNHDELTRELSEKGMKDRLSVTDFLTKSKIDIILSSPYKRAIDTVSDYAKKTGIGIIIVDDFRERRVDSDWIEDFDAFVKKQWADFDYKLSDGECLREVQERNIHALRSVLQTYSGKCIAIGSHGTALCTVINYYDRSFGYNGFEEIRNLMPYIVHFSFDGTKCVRIERYDPLIS